MPSQWDHKADKDLLLTIIEGGNLTHINWQSISSKLEAKNYTFSHEACRQHYQKIRRESRNNATTSTPTKNSTPNNASKSTPASKNQRTPKSVNYSTPNGAGGGEEGDDEEDFQTPSAKRKRVAKKQEPDLGGFAGQTAAQFKIEEFAGGDGVEDENGGVYRNMVDLVDDGIYAV